MDLKYAKNALADPAGGAYDAPPDPLVGWGGGYPSPFPTPSAPRFSRLRRSILGAKGTSTYGSPNVKSWLHAYVHPTFLLAGDAPANTCDIIIIPFMSL